MESQGGLVCAYVLDGKGGGRELGWPEVRAWTPEEDAAWVHLDRKSDDSVRWLREESGLDPLVCDALLAEETRPRSVQHGNGLIVILRGVNSNPGADPEDMVSCRIWVEPRRIVSLRFRRLMAVQDIRDALAAGRGPLTSGDVLVHLASCLIDRAGPVLDDLDDAIDDIEERILELPSQELRARLSDLRRQAIGLRRYFAPQRDVVARMATETGPVLDDRQRLRLREVGDRLLRYVEDLDAARERAAVTHEELAGRISEQMNKTMYVLSLVAAVFLPLGLITGLLGVNVGGIPGTDSPMGFGVLCAVLVVLAIIQAWVFRRMRWF